MNSLLLALAALVPVAQAGTITAYSASDCSGVAEQTVDVGTSCTEMTKVGSGYGTITCDGTAGKWKMYSATDCSGDAQVNFDFTDGACFGAMGSYYKITCGAPCFARDTHATLASGEDVLMSELTAGDYVLPGPTRVIVNQHKNAPHLSSTLLNIEHAKGSISLTPDHVLNVDGSFIAAREAVVGSKLSDSEVSRVTSGAGGIINPLTTSGKITADGVLASTYPEWIAGYMLGRSTASASSLISFCFPATTQTYYDVVLERFFQSSSPTLVHLKAVLPAPLVALTFVAADVLVAAGFVAFSLTSLRSLVALVALGAAIKSRK